MANRDEIRCLILRLRSSMPDELLVPVNQMQFGAGAALQYLYEHQEQAVSAGDLSQFLQVSSARVAALLRRLEARELIVKEKGASDGRVTVVRLSQKGVDYVELRHQQLEEKLSTIVDQIGMEKLEEFMQLGVQIRQCMGNHPNIDL